MGEIISKLNKFSKDLECFKDFTAQELHQSDAFGDLVWLHVYDFITETPELHCELVNRAAYFKNLFKDKDFCELEAEIEAMLADFFGLINYDTVKLLDNSENFQHIVRFFGKRALKNYSISDDFRLDDYKNLFHLLQKTQYFDVNWADYSPIFDFIENTMDMFEVLEAKFDFVFHNIQIYREKMRQFRIKCKKLFELCSYKPKKLAVFEFSKYASICAIRRERTAATQFQMDKSIEFLENPQNYKELFRITRRVLNELTEHQQQKSAVKMEISRNDQSVIYEGKELKLTPRMFDIVLTMAKSPENYLSVEDLYPYSCTNPEQALRTCLAKIKTVANKDLIVNKFSVGYKLNLDKKEILLK